MRLFLGGMLVLAAVVLGMAGLLIPAAAQQSTPLDLPSTRFGAEDPVATAHGFKGAPGFAHAPVANNPDSPDARAVGQQVCTACHVQETANFAHTVHSLGMEAALAADPSTATCEACHGGGSRHIENPAVKGSIIAFTKDGGSQVDTQAASCLGCHAGGQRDQWTGSVH